MKDNAARLSKYEAKTDGSVTGRRFDATKKFGKAAYSYYAEVQARIEATVKRICQDVSVVLLPRYMNYALELERKGSDQERRVVYDKWRARGLTGSKLRELSWALLAWLPTPDTIAFDGTASSCHLSKLSQPGGLTYNQVHDAASATTVVSGTNVTVGQGYGANLYEIHRGAFFFDTSPLGPGSLVLGGSLRFYVGSLATNRSYYVVVQSGAPDYPHKPVVIGDYDFTKYDGNYGQAASGALAVNNYISITLTAAGAALINKTGATKFLLRTDRDISSDAPPAVPGQYERVGLRRTSPVPVLTVLYFPPD